MDSAHRKRQDRLQNVLITLLILSAVALSVRIQMYNLNIRLDFRQLSGSTAAPTAASSRLSALSAPVRVAASGTYGRYGAMQLTTGDWDFSNLFGPRLREALSSAQYISSCKPEALLEALSRPSLYYDFLSPLPLPVLAGMLGTETPAEQASAQYLLLADCGTDGVRLFLRDGQECSIYKVSLSADRLQEAISSCELGNAFFAFDRAENDPAYDAVAPDTLFLEPLPALTALTARTGLSDTGWLLAALGLNPNTKSRYTESGGTEVIMEGEATIRISGGSVLYQSGSQPSLHLNLRGDNPSAEEMVRAANQFLSALFTGHTGEASPYLSEVQLDGKEAVLSFDYQFGGVPIRFSDGGHAAVLTLHGNSVQELTLRIRQYTADNTPTALLPVPQMLAVAAQEPGEELSIAYADNGGETVSAAWISG